MSRVISATWIAVLYHFGSRDGLERAMADALIAELQPVNSRLPWRERFADLAHQYRALALRYPRSFPLLQRFWVTGPADYANTETDAALADAGFDDQRVVDIWFGWHAAVPGLAAADAARLLAPQRPTNSPRSRRWPPRTSLSPGGCCPPLLRSKRARAMHRPSN